MINNWEKAPFINNSGGLLKQDAHTNLPFSIGAITRQGFNHIDSGISNQDAIRLTVKDDLIIGILCDGCTSNHPELLDEFSQNQVGANLIAKMVLNLCYQNILPRKNKMNLEVFAKWLTNEVSQRIKMILRVLKIDKNQHLNFICNNLLSTITGIIIREKEFFIFHYGDGIVKVNKKKYDLSKSSGNYIATSQYMSNYDELSFKIVTKGMTKTLTNVCIASDGFSLDMLNTNRFNKLSTKKPTKNGFIDLIPEFHGEFLNQYFDEKKSLESWPNDDASLIMIRRQKNNN